LKQRDESHIYTNIILANNFMSLSVRLENYL
jgi:hypothetical protein